MNDGNQSDHKRDRYQIILSEGAASDAEIDDEECKKVVCNVEETESENIEVLNPEDVMIVPSVKPARILIQEEDSADDDRDDDQIEEESSVMDVDQVNQILVLEDAENFF